MQNHWVNNIYFEDLLGEKKKKKLKEDFLDTLQVYFL